MPSSIRDLIPRHKADFERVRLLESANPEELDPILGDLLEWVQDMNWPIAYNVEKVLLRCSHELIPYIRDVLNSNDGIWKRNVLSGLAQRRVDIYHAVRPTVIRLANNPSEDDRLEEVDEAAREVIALFEMKTNINEEKSAP